MTAERLDELLGKVKAHVQLGAGISGITRREALTALDELRALRSSLGAPSATGVSAGRPTREGEILSALVSDNPDSHYDDGIVGWRKQVRETVMCNCVSALEAREMPDFWARAVALAQEWERRTGGIMAGREMEELRQALSAAYAEGRRAPAATGESTGTACATCGGDGTALCHAATDIDARIMQWRERAYAAEKFLGRLLGIGLNQAVAEAERRLEHPLGAGQPWVGTRAEWYRANITILEGALTRLRTQAAHGGMECRGVTVDLDAPPPPAGADPRAQGFREGVEAAQRVCEGRAASLARDGNVTALCEASKCALAVGALAPSSDTGSPDTGNPEHEAGIPCCQVPRCHAGMLRDPNGRDEVSCPVCDGTLTAWQWRSLVESHSADAFLATGRRPARDTNPERK